MGIVICGLNGSGKSTLGRALAEKLNFRFIDNEDLYFPKTDSRYLYAAPRTRREVERLLFDEIRKHRDFVFASVKGDYGDAAAPFFQFIILVEIPRDLRLQRVRDRSFQKFGSRMLPGGDLYAQEEAFFALAESRPETLVEDWIHSLGRPVPLIRVDGTRPVDENLKIIEEWLAQAASAYEP